MRPLLVDHVVPVSATPVVHGSHRACEAALGRGLAHDRIALPRPHPVMGEAEEVECRALPAPSGPVRSEVQVPRLVRVEPQPVPVVLEKHHGVIGVPHQQAAPPHARLHLPLKPLVQHVVQVQIREQGADHTALRGALPGPLQDALFEHPGLEPFVQHPPDHSVLDPQVEELPQVRVRDRIEVFRNVRINHPPLPFHRALPHCVQGVMGGAARAEPVRAR